MRRICLALVLMVIAGATAGCGSSSGTAGSPGGGSGANNGGGGGGGGGGGTATATVTFDSHTYNLTGGKCTDIGTVLGTEVTVGDYANAEAGPGDYLEMMVKGNTVTLVQGRAGGVPWALASGKQQASISGGRGTFSGTDFVSGKEVSGTFACN